MNDTVAACATAQAPGGIGVIRISGPDARAVADRVFENPKGKKISDAKGYTMLYGRVHDGGEAIDEAVALVFAAPRSYTGEDVVELDCHGGMWVTKRLLRAVLGAGARLAEPGEFTRRAFLSGRISLTQAEAVMDVIGARGSAASRAALSALEGATASRISGILSKLTAAAAALAAWTDYPEEDLPPVEGGDLLSAVCEAREDLKSLLSNFDAGQAVTAGIPTVIAGRPNVGKSTLMNLLSGEERSIVTDIAGTTRDVVETTVLLGNVTLLLADTAGIRISGDAVESAGVERAKKRIDTASLVLAVFDASSPLTDEDREVIEACKGRLTVCVLNKADLGECKISPDELPGECVRMSAREGLGLSALEGKVEELLGTAEFDPSAGILANERQRSCAKKALDELDSAAEALKNGMTLDAAGVCIDLAMDSLLSLTGERVSERVVEEVFSRFCVGK